MKPLTERIAMGIAIFSLTLGTTGCSLDALLHTTASLGGDTANQRGNVDVLFINETPHRAIFTFGTYDEFDRDTEPVLRQFGSDDGGPILEGNTQSAVLQFQCSRVFSIGSDGLIARVRLNLDEDGFDDDLLISGVNFSSADTDSDQANEPTEGVAAPHDAFIGPDFECGALLIYRLEFNEVGPEEFVIELTVIPAESSRG